jgi:hypothetical protein
MLQAGRFQHQRLLGMMDGNFQPAWRAHGRAVQPLQTRLPAADGPVNARLAQGQRLFDAGHRQGVSIYSAGDANQAMTVAIRLNGGRHFSSGRGCPNPPQIVNQRPQIESAPWLLDS